MRGVESALLEDQFMRNIYRLIEESERLTAERPKAKKVTRDTRPTLTKLRNVRKTVQIVRRKFSLRQTSTGTAIHAEVWGRLYQALDAFEDEVREKEQHLVGNLHPEERKPHDTPPRFEALVRTFHYPLKSVRKKASDQWLYESLNTTLIETLSGKGISDMTRYRLISAFLSASGREVKPITLKQYFHSKKSAN